MRIFFNLLQTDLRRAFGCARFWALTAGTAALLFCNTLEDSQQFGTFAAPETLINAIECSKVQSFTQMTLILAALAYAFSFCEDWKNRNIRNIVIRSSQTKYAVSKIIVCAVSAFSVIFLGYLLFVWLESFFVPSVYGNSNLENFLKTGAFDHMLAQGQFVPWVILQAARLALEGAVFAVASLAISTVMTNTFVVLTFPVFAYFFVSLITQYVNLPLALDIRILYEGDKVCLGQSVPVHMLWAVVFTILLCALLGALFSAGVRRKFENG